MITTEEIKKNLAELKSINPDQSFKKASRAMILSRKNEEKWVFFGVPLSRVAGGFALLLLIIASLTLELSPTPAISASFNPNYLQNEFETLTINAQIEEIAYREKANQTIASALTEVENTSVQHLNGARLREEAGDIELDDSTNPEIDVLLEKVIE